MELALRNKLPKQDGFLRVLSVGCGCGMIALGVFDYILFDLNKAIDVVLPSYYM